jgi:hypothetical protein
MELLKFFVKPLILAILRRSLPYLIDELAEKLEKSDFGTIKGKTKSIQNLGTPSNNEEASNEN